MAKIRIQIQHFKKIWDADPDSSTQEAAFFRKTKKKLYFFNIARIFGGKKLARFCTITKNCSQKDIGTGTFGKDV